MIGIVLAGGAARRLGGGDKGLLAIAGVPILDRVVTTLRAQCESILISANGDAMRFARFGCPVVPDDAPDRRGPLAGVLAALDAIASRHPSARHAVTVPTDTPFLPHDLVARLAQIREATGAAIVCARSGGRVHPTIAVWSLTLRPDLRAALEREGIRKVGAFVDRHAHAGADWPIAPYDPFFNVNTADDLAGAAVIAEALAAR